MCSTKFENQFTIKKFRTKNIFQKGILFQKIASRGCHYFPEILKKSIFYPKCLKSTPNGLKDLPEANICESVTLPEIKVSDFRIANCLFKIILWFKIFIRKPIFNFMMHIS